MRIMVRKVIDGIAEVTIVPGINARLAPIVLVGPNEEALWTSVAETIKDVSRKEHPGLFPERL